MKCILCGKEFPENISDYDLVQHFIKNHKNFYDITFISLFFALQEITFI